MEQLVKIHSPLSPQAPQNPSKSLAEAIRAYFGARRIWETIGDSFALNDEVSRQVRRNTLRFRVRQEHWLGV